MTRRVCRERGHRWCHLIDPNRPWRQHCTRWGCHASRVNPRVALWVGADWS